MNSDAYCHHCLQHYCQHYLQHYCYLLSEFGRCVLQAVIDKQLYSIDWRVWNNSEEWGQGGSRIFKAVPKTAHYRPI